MKSNRYILIALVIALFFWLFDSLVHFYVYNESQFELIVSSFNELWMRLISICLVISFGVYAGATTKKQLEKKKQLEAEKNLSVDIVCE